MIWTLPGTTIEANLARGDADAMLTPMFLTGGLVLSQVAQLTGLPAHTVQNWVRRGFLSPPVGKKYSRRQFCRILLINMLHGALPMETICALLSYVNGSLSDESDDSIDDARLYLCLVRLVSFAEREGRSGAEDMEEQYDAALSDYSEPFPGAKKRICDALHVMVTAWRASRLRQETELLLAALELPDKQGV